MISVALKTPLEIRLGICIYKTSLLHRPDDYIGFTPRCPPTFYNKIARMVMPSIDMESMLTLTKVQLFRECLSRTIAVQRILGLANQLAKFVPNLAETTKPLCDLLRKDKSWRWGVEAERAFNDLKRLLVDPGVLRQFDPRLRTIVCVRCFFFIWPGSCVVTRL